MPLLRRLDKAKGQPAAAGETSATSGSGGGGAADAGGSGTARRTRAGEAAAAGARPPATGGTESTGPAAASTTTTTTQTAGSHLLEGSLRDGSDPLAVLDPTLHSIGYLYILCVLSDPYSRSGLGGRAKGSYSLRTVVAA